MKTLDFECDDLYEAEKLAGLMSVQKDNSVWVSRVEAMVANEIVIQLKDRSSHAVLLKDEPTVARLKLLIDDLSRGKIKIQSSNYIGSITEIIIVD
ncbi:MAG: hypothetical protein M3270_04905 [Thermoproteota archaeon]|nr:hypothetical protein [Thermoproteota archaeon]